MEYHSVQNELRSLPLELRIYENDLLIVHMKGKSINIDRIREAQNNNLKLVKLKQEVKNGLRTDFLMKDDDLLIMGNRLYVPHDEELRKVILEEAHSAHHTRCTPVV